MKCKFYRICLLKAKWIYVEIKWIKYYSVY